jgi:hypothetical protein
MSQPHPELLILLITLVALALAPLASHLVRNIGADISAELDGGRTGETLSEYLDSAYEGALRDDEIAQMLEARAFLREDASNDLESALSRYRARAGGAGLPGDDGDLRDEVRQLVVASNERRVRAGKQPLDVESEVVRRLARLLRTNGHSHS